MASRFAIGQTRSRPVHYICTERENGYAGKFSERIGTGEDFTALFVRPVLERVERECRFRAERAWNGSPSRSAAPEPVQ